MEGVTGQKVPASRSAETRGVGPSLGHPGLVFPYEEMPTLDTKALKRTVCMAKPTLELTHIRNDALFEVKCTKAVQYYTDGERNRALTDSA